MNAEEVEKSLNEQKTIRKYLKIKQEGRDPVEDLKNFKDKLVKAKEIDDIPQNLLTQTVKGQSFNLTTLASSRGPLTQSEIKSAQKIFLQLNFLSNSELGKKEIKVGSST